MPLSDYAHHNEDAQAIWWLEEGRFQGTEQERPYCPLCGGSHEDFDCPENMFGDEEEEDDWDDEDDVEPVGDGGT